MPNPALHSIIHYSLIARLNQHGVTAFRGGLTMVERRSDYDVTNRVNTTDPKDVSEEVCRIYQDLYQLGTPQNLNQAFADLARLYRGENPGY